MARYNMNNLTQQIEDKKKGCGSLFIDENGNDAPCKLLLVDRVEPEPHFCPACKEIIAIIEQAIAEMQKQRQEISKSLRERIMRNGNLSNRIVETECGEFEHKHDYILNEIVCEIIEETLQQLNQPKEERKELHEDEFTGELY